MRFERFCSLLLFLAIAAAACVMPAQSDTWWHLRAGQEIWRTHTIPLLDSFSHTVSGGYWPDHEWLTQAMFYGIYRKGGMPLLTAVAALVATLTWWIVWRLTPGPHMRRVALVAAAVIPSSMAWSIRPQVFTLFLVALTALVVVRRLELLLPVVFIIWANLHGAVLLGLVVVIASTIGASLHETRRVPRLLFVTLACIGATMMTPLGVKFWTEMPASLARIHEYQISEWRAPSLNDPAFWTFWLFAAVVVALMIHERPWRRMVPARNQLVWAASAVLPLAVLSARNIPPFMVLAVPAIGTFLAAKRPMLARARRRLERTEFHAVVATGAAIAAVAIVAYAWIAKAERLGWQPLPERAITAVRSCPENLYNRYDDGGYLIWFAGRKVFLDGRQDPYPPELIREQVRVETSGEFQPTFDRYHIQCAFTPTGSLLTERLMSAGWVTLYGDPQWMVLARN